MKWSTYISISLLCSWVLPGQNKNQDSNENKIITLLDTQSLQNPAHSYYRITEGWKGPGGHLVQPPLLKGHLKPVDQDHVQMAFEDFQGWRHPLGKHFQSFTTVTAKKGILLCLNGILCISVCAHNLLFCHQAQVRRVWLCLSHSSQSGIYTHLQQLPEPSSG